MIRSFEGALRWLFKAALLGAAWAVLFRFNASVFEDFAISDHANWIFLPAGLRVLMPLVFRSSGVAGLVLGSLLITPPTPDNLMAPLLFALASGLAPVVGIAICNHIFRLKPDLSGLGPIHLLALSLLCGASNSFFVNLCLLLTGSASRSGLAAITVFIGDVAGTAIILYVIAAALSLLARLPSQKK